MASRPSHGVYVGNDPAALSSFNSWNGAPADNVLNYLNNDSWSAFDSSVPWVTSLWSATPTPSIWSVPLTVTGTPLEQVASGAFNDHFRLAAEALAKTMPSADGHIYVRVGWEFNGNWMPWSAEGHEQGFIGAYRQLVDTFRSASDKFKFVWDVNEGGSFNPAKAYPGDAYVDVVGMDTYYNTRWDSTDAHAAFQGKVHDQFGLQWQQDFAAAHGKPTAISEWGVQTDASGAFVQDMARWLSDHNVVFDNYWQSNAAQFHGELRQYPTTAAAYQEAFGHTLAPAGPAHTPPALSAQTSLPTPHSAGLAGNAAAQVTHSTAAVEPATQAPLIGMEDPLAHIFALDTLHHPGA